MSLTSFITLAAESGGEPAIPAPLVGLIAFAILLALLFGLTMFGKGRDHS
jgi:hypothetical protein